MDNNYIKLSFKPGIVSQFYDQDKELLDKAKPENKAKVKEIIANYGMINSMDYIFKNFANDYDKFKFELEQFSKKRKVDLYNLTKHL